MIAFGIALNLVGLGVFCWLLFTLAIYALPFFVGVAAGLCAYHTGAGPLGAITLALLAGGGAPPAAPIGVANRRHPLGWFRPSPVLARTDGARGLFADADLSPTEH